MTIQQVILLVEKLYWSSKSLTPSQWVFPLHPDKWLGDKNYWDEARCIALWGSRNYLNFLKLFHSGEILEIRNFIYTFMIRTIYTVFANFFFPPVLYWSFDWFPLFLFWKLKMCIRVDHSCVQQDWTMGFAQWEICRVSLCPFMKLSNTKCLASWSAGSW